MAARARSVAGIAPVVLAAVCFVVLANPVQAAAGTVDLVQAIDLVKREVAAVGASGAPDRASGGTLQVETVQLDFVLVEVADKGGPHGAPYLAVPAVDFRNARDAGRDAGREAGKDAVREAGRQAGKDLGRDLGRDGTARSSLRRHLTLELQVPRPLATRGKAATVSTGAEAERRAAGSAPASVLVQGRGADARADASPSAGPSAGGPLSRAILEIAEAARDASTAEPAFEAKRLSVDLDFAIGRDDRGAPVLIVYAADQPIDARNVHKLHVRLVTADRPRPFGRSAGREAARAAVPPPDAGATRAAAGP